MNDIRKSYDYNEKIYAFRKKTRTDKKILNFLGSYIVKGKNFVTRNIIKDGDLNRLKWIYKKTGHWCGDECDISARYGEIECLKYTHENGCEWDAKTCNFAALGGYLKCLQYAHKHGCRWTSETCENAARGGHLDCLKYAHENGCNWNVETFHAAVKRGDLDCLKYVCENECIVSMVRGQFGIVKLYYSGVVGWNDVCFYSAKCGNLESLKYAHQKGCKWDEGTCINAAENGHLDCLKYAHENGCPWDVYTCIYANNNGNVECLKYAVENGCPFGRTYTKKSCLNELNTLLNEKELLTKK